MHLRIRSLLRSPYLDTKAQHRLTPARFLPYLDGFAYWSDHSYQQYPRLPTDRVDESLVILGEKVNENGLAQEHGHSQEKEPADGNYLCTDTWLHNLFAHKCQLVNRNDQFCRDNW